MATKAKAKPTPKATSKPKKRRRAARSSMLFRWVAIGALVLIAFSYYRPLQSYFSTKQELAQRSAEVRILAAQHKELEHRLATSGTKPALIREARRLGLIRPGERLFIVKGIADWNRKPAAKHRRP
jgi:cell division protein FtsB